VPNQETITYDFLKVSKNGRYLQDKKGKPFLYLDCTAWDLFHRLNREEAVDPTKPNESYFKHFDFILNEAEELRLYIGMLPT